jgi:cytochrome d ubiquinol oxidase subunit I
MQRPVGYAVNDGRAELTSIWQLLSNDFALWAYGHVLLAGLTTGAVVVFGVACWNLVRGRDVELFRRAAKVSLIVLVPVSAFNLWFGSHFGIYTTEYQPMKIAATEAQWNTCQPCAFSVIQIGGFTEDDQTPSFSIQIPRLLSFLATGSFSGEVQGMNEVQSQYERQYGRGEDYIPPVRTVYWAMRIMAGFGTLVFAVAALGAFLFWRGRLERSRRFLWTAVATIPLPFMAALAGWVLTEVGRQPWIVQGLLKTSDANSPNVSETMLVGSLTVIALLYAMFIVLDVWLMRRYARYDSEPEGKKDQAPEPALGF